MPLPMPETDPEDDEKPIETADVDSPVWDKELVPDSRDYLCFYEMKFLGWPPQPDPMPVTPPLQPNQGVSAMLLQ